MDAPWINDVGFDPETHQGFIYLICNNINQRKYIGRKYSTTWYRGIRVESNWKTYWGSSPSLHRDIRKYGKENFERSILIPCKSREETNITEIRVLFALEVLTSILPDQTKEFYNQVIGLPWPHRFRGGHRDFWTDFWDDYDND